MEKLNSLKAGPKQRVAAFVAEVASAGDAIGFVRAAVVPLRISPGAGCGERRQIQVLRGIVGVLRLRDLVRPVKAFARSRVVALEFVVKVPGLAILQVEDAVEAPAVLQLRHRSPHLGELVGEVPSEAAANVEARVSAVSRGIGAVLRLRLVGFEIFKIAGGVDGMRPDKVGLRGQPVPTAGAQTGLQRVVDGCGRRLLLVQVEEIWGDRARNAVAGGTVVAICLVGTTPDRQR